ncbi:MAG: (2Fe-2S)-binding protein [Pseudomonadota bacterium]|nr:(2Fe-2S)-binding protein [Pseudomonadota bacterium]
MIVCSCNAIREDEIRVAARRGCPCADSAYRSLGCEFQCGSCLDFAEEVVAAERAALLAVTAQAA